MKHHYIYMIKFSDGRFYIGARSSKLPPEQDTGYWGSPITYKHLWNDSSLEKTKHILKVCDSFEQKQKLEPEFIKEAWDKFGDLCLNRSAIAAVHPDVSKKAGKLGGNKSKELGVGIHGLTKEEHIKNSSVGGNLGGNKSKELGVGIFKLTKEERVKNGSVGGKLGGKISKELGLGIFGLSKEQRVKNAKIGARIAEEKITKEYCLKSPTGEIKRGKNISELCRTYGLYTSCICKVISGKRKSHKGWTLP